jgi:RimJ/RimL family protein N-acetyltransferase
MLAGNLTMVAVRRNPSSPVGFFQAYNFAPDSGWAFVLAFLQPGLATPGISVEAGYLFTEYLFNAFPLRKLYADVFEYNHHVLKLLDRIGAREEGRFDEHIWYGDQYWASIRLALYRKDWRARGEHLRRLIPVQQDIDAASERLQ